NRILPGGLAALAAEVWGASQIFLEATRRDRWIGALGQQDHLPLGGVRITDWTVGCATLGSPRPLPAPQPSRQAGGPLPRGEGEWSSASRSHACRSLA